MRVLTVPIMEGIDGEEEDKMSATTDSLNTSNDDKQSNTSICNDMNNQSDINDTNNSNNIKNEFDLNNDDYNKMNNDNDDKIENQIENKIEIKNENESNKNVKNKEILLEVKTSSSNLSNPSFAISNDTADRTYHESASHSIILGNVKTESPTAQNNIFVKDKYTIENLNEDKDKTDNDNLDLTKCTDKERTESNPRDELILTFATAILKSGTRSTDSLNDNKYDNKSLIDHHVTSSSESSRRNSQVHSASGTSSHLSHFFNILYGNQHKE